MMKFESFGREGGAGEGRVVALHTPSV